MDDWKRSGNTPERLKEAMAHRQISQGELADKAGLSKSSISRYLSGIMEPKNGAVNKLAKALNVSEMWLWGYDVPMTRSPEQKKNDTIASAVVRMRSDLEFFEVVSMLAELPAEQYASIKQIISALGGKK